jgi:hypothetical protein
MMTKRPPIEERALKLLPKEASPSHLTASRSFRVCGKLIARGS